MTSIQALKSLGKALTLLLITFLWLEISSRAYWRITAKVPLTAPGKIPLSFYPELEPVNRLRPSADDNYHDILLLGGSVLNDQWGSVSNELHQLLKKKQVNNIRIFNLAIPAHTSRDSLLKYKALKDHRFDQIIFYHGINETRANNIPEHLFRTDYSHFDWYAIVNAMAKPDSNSLLALPFTLKYLNLLVHNHFSSHNHIPRHSPKKEWVHYGSAPKSASSIRANVKEIAQTAAERGDKLAITTFSLYIPKNYSLERFRAKQLDYQLHLTPLELWGHPAHVIAATKAHNKELIDIAKKDQTIQLVRADQLMPKGASYFNDPCHLTPSGSLELAKILALSLYPKARHKASFQPANAQQ